MPNLLPLLDTQEFTVADQKGRERKFLLSKFPAVAGRAICTQYPLSALPKVGEYHVNEQIMLRLMSYVGVNVGAPETLRLETVALIESHCGDWETLGRVEVAMLEYNCSFFSPEKALNFLDLISEKLPKLVSKMLTDSLAQSSTPAKPPMPN